MELRRIALIAIPILSFGTYLSYQWLQQQSNESHVKANVSPTSTLGIVKQAMIPLTSPAQTTEAKDNGVAALREEVASLRAEVFSIRRQLAAQGAAANTDIPTGSDVRMNPLARAEADRERQQQIAGVESNFRKEGVNQKWATTASSALQYALNSDEVGRLQANSIECHSATCRVEVNDDGSGRLDKSLPILAQQLAGTLPNIVANRVDLPNGTSTMVLYMSRQSGQQSR